MLSKRDKMFAEEKTPNKIQSQKTFAEDISEGLMEDIEEGAVEDIQKNVNTVSVSESRLMKEIQWWVKYE